MRRRRAPQPPPPPPSPARQARPSRPPRPAAVVPAPGANCYISVQGSKGCFYDVAEFVCPTDDELVELPARLIPGRYVFAGRGFPSASPGGARGDLVVDYHWPAPIRGADVHYPMVLSKKQRRTGVTFVSPTTDYALTLPGGSGDEPVGFPGQGMAGEFGGKRGDLIVDIEVAGRGQGRPPEASLTGVGLLARTAGWLVLVGAIVVALLVAVYALWHRL